MLTGVFSFKKTVSLAVAVVAVTLATALSLSSSSAKGTSGGSMLNDPTSTLASTQVCEVKADLDVVIAIDRTGSMNDQSGGQTKLHWAKQAALALVNGIAGGSSNSTLGSNDVEVLTFDGASAADRVVPFSSDADALRTAINGIGDSSGAGDTDIAKGLEGATADLNAHVHSGSNGSYKVVVLLSDGRNYASGDPTSGTNCPATHQRRQDTLNDIPALHAAADTVYTVGVGSQIGTANSCNSSELDETLLQAIAEGPPGDYTHVTDASTLPDIYSGISQDVVNICANFSGHKYDDLACDGPAGDNPPLSGVDVKLLDAQGTPVAQTLTDADGVYSFDNVPEGSYSICEDLSALPGGTQQSYPISGSAQTGAHSPYGVCYERTLAGGQSESDLDFYNCPPPVVTPTPCDTNTPVPPTATPANTDTPVPPTATPANTDTPVPPTATPANTDTPVPPTATNVSTEVPPTATSTSAPAATATEEHQNATDTPTQAASTATAVPSTPTPRGQVASAEETRQPPAPAQALPASGAASDRSFTPWTAIAGALASLAATLILLGGVRLAWKKWQGRE